ncbi:MAG: glycosyltransferase family 39 protein [Anaerolineae bacterium]|nr:glycosyltransferase family 39 protein [Anaerolineae bacterium]
MRTERRTHRLEFTLLGVALLLLAALVRFHLLGAQSLWNDEGNAYVQATRSLAEIADHAARDIHPPGYYWLLALWRGLFGQTEFALRALSAFASVSSVAFAYALGRRLYGAVAGVMAALVIGLNTFSIYYAQEARMYALLALWGVASLWALAHLLRLRKTSSRLSARQIVIRALPLALFNAAGLYTQYAYVYVLVTQGVVVLLWLAGSLAPDARRTLWRVLATYVAANVIALLLFLPWLPVALQQIATWPNTGQSTPLFESLSVILNWLIFGLTSQNASLAVAWLVLLFGLMRMRGGRAWATLLPVAWVVISVGLFLAQGLFRANNLKFLLPAQIGMALWMGRGIWVLWHGLAAEQRERRLVKWLPTVWITRLAATVAALVLLFALWQGLNPLYDDPAYQRADYRAIAARAEAELSVGDAVILNGPNQAEVFGYYYAGAAPVYGLPPGLGGDDALTRDETDAVLTHGGSIYAVFWGDAERDPNRVVETALDEQAYLLDDTWYGDVRLARYRQPEAMTSYDVGATFEHDIHLLGARVSSGDFTAGDDVLVALEWEADTALAARYKVFVQLLYPDGTLAAQHDGEPVGNSLPTTLWEAGEPVEDHHALQIPPDAPPGEYRLIAGLYAADPPYTRLLTDDGADYVEIGRISVIGQ